MDTKLILDTVKQYNDNKISWADASLLLISYGLSSEEVVKLLKEK